MNLGREIGVREIGVSSLFATQGNWAGSLQGLIPGAPTDTDVRVKTHPVLHAVESLSLTRLGRFVVTRW